MQDWWVHRLESDTEHGTRSTGVGTKHGERVHHALSGGSDRGGAGGGDCHIGIDPHRCGLDSECDVSQGHLERCGKALFEALRVE